MRPSSKFAILALSLSFVLCTALIANAQTSAGSITGTVLDRNGNAVPGATVTLSQNGQVVAAPENPQMSVSNQIFGSIGRYTFNNLPYGTYTVTAAKTDAAGVVHQSTATVTLNSGTATGDVVINDLVYMAPSTATPTPTPTPTPAGQEWLIFSGIAVGIAALAMRKKG